MKDDLPSWRSNDDVWVVVHGSKLTLKAVPTQHYCSPQASEPSHFLGKPQCLAKGEARVPYKALTLILTYCTYI